MCQHRHYRSKCGDCDDRVNPPLFPGWRTLDERMANGEGYGLDLDERGVVVVTASPTRFGGKPFTGDAAAARAFAHIRHLALYGNSHGETARRALITLGEPDPLPAPPDTPAPIAALRWVKDALSVARGPDGGAVMMDAAFADLIVNVIDHAVRHHWNDACYSLLDCSCGKCVMCGEPVEAQRTPADRYDEEFPDTDQGPDACTGCGAALDLADLRRVA